ncbi:MAG: penicillin-binding protein 1C [Verrucomicrobia bacterium]|nr:MAG: penicillin-binding protein 1C [Verrucomicrobiota bacterium]
MMALRSRWFKKTLRVPVMISCCAILVWLALPKPPLLDGISFSQCVRDRDGNLLRVTLSADQKFRVQTALRGISPELIQATLQFEDKHFAQHPGINPVALLRSVTSILPRHARTGGSTITMQLARLRFHLQTRTVAGKAVQILRELELERHYSKSEILEAYFNLAPYGRNIEGADAASEIYFGKQAARLTRPEAIALSVIPQSPTRRALLIDRENGLLNNAQRKWHDRVSPNVDAEFSNRLFRAQARGNTEFLAPHFVQQVLETNKANREIVTTLDLARQRLIERRVSDYVAATRTRGIENAAVLLVDTRTLDVLAQIGSADFRDKEINGQVDGTRSSRSPGSTLKPFVYALAMEQGIIHPLSVLADAPRSFGEYNPENFDRDFLGPIRASDALARSRNVPAVSLAAQLSRPNLYEFLRRAGVPLPEPESHYGLALPLGGAEVTMQDLVQLYAALGNNGELRLLRRTSRDPISRSGLRILSPEASFLTLQMLGNVPRPEMNCADATNSVPVYWKTGTSHGFHDAWSIGVFDHYVLAVWIGNFDGHANGAFVGRTAAAPLFFQIIDSLRANWPKPGKTHLSAPGANAYFVAADFVRGRESATPATGANLKRVEFCAVSGDLPNAFCHDRVEGWFIPGISPIKTCEVHREVLVDAATGLRLATDDGTREIRRETYEFWPSDLLRLFERAGVARRSPPPFLPGTASEFVARSGNSPRIVSPLPNSEILFAVATAIPLRAKADADVRDVYWFAGKTFLGKCNAADVLSWKSAPGDYDLTALDDHGRSGWCKVRVR